MCKKLNITVEQLYNMADNNNSTNFQPVKTIANDLECTSYNTKKNDKDSINALDLLKQTYHLSKLEYAIIKGYSELSKEQRYTFEKFIQNIIYDIVDPIGNSIIKDAKNDLDNLKKSKSKNQKELG